MPVTCLFGMQWGDEGKGCTVDLLAERSDAVVRYQGGANAGHTVVVGEDRYVFHLLPSGVIQPKPVNVIANGVVVDPWTLVGEVDDLAARGISLEGRLLLSDRAHVVLPYHKQLDMAMERLRGGAALGTTSRGIGPTYGDRATREGLRVADVLAAEGRDDLLRSRIAARNEILTKAGLEPVDDDQVIADVAAVAERLRPWVTDTAAWLQDAWRAGRTILLEGAQGFGLDLDHGSYPFVTSSNTGTGSVCSGTGLPPRAVDRVIGVVKAYTTRVGAGPFPTQADEAPANHMATRGDEFGATTGRPRSCGWFDGVLARRAARSQGVDAVALTKLDVLSGLDEIRVCVAYDLNGTRIDVPPARAADWVACRPMYETYAGWGAQLDTIRRYEDMPRDARIYVRAIQDLLGVPVETIGVGPDREQVIPTGAGIPTPA